MPAKSKFTSEYNFYDDLAILKIRDIRPEDGGTYKCIAKNPLGQDETSAEVFVCKTPNVDQNPIMNPDSFTKLSLKSFDIPLNILENEEYYFPPKVIIPLQSINCKEGSNIIFTCKIDGYPKPEVIFKSSKLYRKVK